MLFWGPRLFFCEPTDKKASISLQAATGTSAWPGQVPPHSEGRSWVNVLSLRSVFVLSWQRVTLNPGSHLPSSPQARWKTETSTYPSPGDTLSYNKWLLNKSSCLRIRTTASQNGKSTLLFSHLLNSSENSSLGKPWHYNGCAIDSAGRAWQSPSFPLCFLLCLNWLLSLPVPPVFFFTAHFDAEQHCLTLCLSRTYNILARQFSLLGT